MVLLASIPAAPLSHTSGFNATAGPGSALKEDRFSMNPSPAI